MGTEYSPGEKVPQSGIYKVTHDGHTPAHEVTCVKDEPFPPCNTCKHPRFELVKAAQHITTHEHFKKK